MTNQVLPNIDKEKDYCVSYIHLAYENYKLYVLFGIVLTSIKCFEKV